MVKILTIESTCDETAAAVIDENLTVLGEVVATQAGLHEKFGGVVPEIASRAHLERILPVIAETLSLAKIEPNALDAVAVANTPGLAGSILVGLSAAKALCLAIDKPLLAINHLQAHIYACRVAAAREVFPCVGLIISGGHSNLYRCAGPIDFTPLGTTIDDAAGEAFDKVAAMLGLPYPGGPSIQKCADGEQNAGRPGNPKAYRFPRPLLNEPDRLQFSFSGLKTAVRYQIMGPGRIDHENAAWKRLSEQQRADIAASFQEAVVDCLVGKGLAALTTQKMKTLCVGGGVAANRRFREKIGEATKVHGIELFIAPPRLCTDNAVMGAVAVERFKAGLFEPLDLDAYPGLVRLS